MDLFQSLFLAGMLVVWFMYVVEAFRESLVQGFLTIFVPFYVLYFAFIRSPHARIQAWCLVAFTAIFLLL